MSVDILRREAVLAALARLEIVALIFMGWQLSYREDNLAEPATTWLFASVILMIVDLVRRELKATVSTPNWALIFIALSFVSVKVWKGYLLPAEATCLRTAVTTVRCCISALDTDQAYWTVIVW